MNTSLKHTSTRYSSGHFKIPKITLRRTLFWPHSFYCIANCYCIYIISSGHSRFSKQPGMLIETQSKLGHPAKHKSVTEDSARFEMTFLLLERKKASAPYETVPSFLRDISYSWFCRQSSHSWSEMEMRYVSRPMHPCIHAPTHQRTHANVDGDHSPQSTVPFDFWPSIHLHPFVSAKAFLK